VDEMVWVDANPPQTENKSLMLFLSKFKQDIFYKYRQVYFKMYMERQTIRKAKVILNNRKISGRNRPT
jgi:hypothetical protein